MIRTHVVAPVLVSLLALPFLAVAAPPAAIGATAGASSAASARAVDQAAAADKFARAVTRRARDGWHIRDLDVALEDDGDMALSLTLASRKAARRFTLTLADDGSRVTGYSNTSARTPRERRIYPIEAELFRLLASEVPSGVDYECGSFFLGGLETGLAIDPMDYHVVEDRQAGWAAPSTLASALASSLDSGLDLVSIEESESEGPGATTRRAIEFSFAGQNDENSRPKNETRSRIIHVELDPRDRVVAVEIRRVPHVSPWQVYSRGAQLRRSLESRAAISRITMAGDDAGSVILDGKLVIDMADFAVGDIECPC